MSTKFRSHFSLSAESNMALSKEIHHGHALSKRDFANSIPCRLFDNSLVSIASLLISTGSLCY
jgi:hypothetical protein